MLYNYKALLTVALLLLLLAWVAEISPDAKLCREGENCGQSASVWYLCDTTVFVSAFNTGAFSVQGSFEGEPIPYTHQFDLKQGDTVGIGLSSPVDAVTVWYNGNLAAYLLLPYNDCEEK